jgi:hypothetical protein
MQQPSLTPPQLAESVFARLADLHACTGTTLKGCVPLLLDSCRFGGFPEAADIKPEIVDVIKLRLRLGPVLTSIIEASFSNTATAADVFSVARHTLSSACKDGLGWLEDMVLKVVQTACLQPETVTQPGEIRNLFLSLDQVLVSLSQGYLKVGDLDRSLIIAAKPAWQEQLADLQQAENVPDALQLACKQGRLWVVPTWREAEINMRLAIHGYQPIASRLKDFALEGNYPLLVAQQVGLRPITNILSPAWQDAYTALEVGAATVSAA